jgi:hypothetical protein
MASTASGPRAGEPAPWVAPRRGPHTSGFTGFRESHDGDLSPWATAKVHGCQPGMKLARGTFAMRVTGMTLRCRR